jgi:hypothetical protein
MVYQGPLCWSYKDKDAYSALQEVSMSFCRDTKVNNNTVIMRRVNDEYLIKERPTVDSTRGSMEKVCGFYFLFRITNGQSPEPIIFFIQFSTTLRNNQPTLLCCLFLLKYSIRKNCKLQIKSNYIIILILALLFF